MAMGRSNGPGDGTPQDEGAVPGDESDEEVSTFDGEDVEEGVEPGGEAPTDETLTYEETAEIEKQVAEITTAKAGRAPEDQVSVDPEEVS
jgi:hypothetical protein